MLPSGSRGTVVSGPEAIAEAAPAHPARPPLWLADAGLALACALLVALVAELVSRQLGLGLVDDAYISLRYAENWAHGQGLVFNPGERVEGFSNFLYVACEAALICCGLRSDSAASLPSGVAQAAIAALIYRLLRRQGVRWQAGAAVAACLIALEPSLLAWSRAGLEGPVYTLFVLAALHFALVSRPTPGSVTAAMTAAVLGAATRPEGVLLIPLTALTVARVPSARRKAVRAGCCAAAVCAAGFVARRAYYGQWLPNTYYAKLDGSSLAVISRGAQYVGLAFALVLPAVLLSLASLWLLRPGAPGARAAPWLCVVLAWLLLLAAGVVWEGGDYFGMHRFMTPLFALLGLSALGPWLCAEHTQPRSRCSRAALGATMAAMLLGWLAAVDLPLPHASNWQVLAAELDRGRLWVAAGEVLRRRSPPDAVIGALAIGGIGERSRRVIVDGLGLIDARIAHLPIELGRGVPGHEKFDVDAFFARRPDAILLPPQPVDMRLPRAWINTVVGGPFLDRLKSDRRLDAGYALYYLPVGDRHWLHTFIRRNQIARWRLDGAIAAAEPKLQERE